MPARAGSRIQVHAVFDTVRGRTVILGVTTGVSQSQFSALPGVSVRTLQEWAWKLQACREVLSGPMPVRKQEYVACGATRSHEHQVVAVDPRMQFVRSRVDRRSEVDGR